MQQDPVEFAKLGIPGDGALKATGVVVASNTDQFIAVSTSKDAEFGIKIGFRTASIGIQAFTRALQIQKANTAAERAW